MRTRIIDEMGLVRKICELGHAQRKEAGIKVRQPLASLKVQSLKFNEDLTNLIKDELNIKSVEYFSGDELKVELDTKLTPELEKEGQAREIIRQIQDARKEAKTVLDQQITVYLPDWPKEFEDYIKIQTLATKLFKNNVFRIEI